MDYKIVQLLLNKYWKGETSLDEEKELFEYFNSKEIDERLIQYKSLFKYISVEKSKHLKNEFKEDVLIDKSPSIRRINWRMNIAAACILLLSGFFIWNFYSSDNNKKYAAVKEIEDPELAYQITKEALMLVSSKLNNGASHAAEKVNKMKEINKYVKTKK